MACSRTPSCASTLSRVWETASGWAFSGRTLTRTIRVRTLTVRPARRGCVRPAASGLTRLSSTCRRRSYAVRATMSQSFSTPGEIPGLSERRPHANMLRIIEATLPSESEPAFETPGEAIEFSKFIDRTRHHTDMASCVGRIIRAADWRDDSFSLYLDNHKVLQFGCAEYGVDVIIGDDPPSTVVGGPRTQEIVLVRLKNKEIYWKRDELMRALPSHAVDRIQMGQSGLFLYVTKIGIVAVSVLIDRSTSRPFLFWEMVD